MTPLDWLVVAAGVAAIGWVNWYFFLAERRGTSDERAERGRSHSVLDAGPR